MYAFLVSAAVIFVAELGDKSQLMALTFAARYRARDVLLGITIATAIVHLAGDRASGLGRHRCAGRHGLRGPAMDGHGARRLAFLVFAGWTLRGDRLSSDEAGKPRANSRAAIVAVGVAFLLAELGDKTMLATIALATTQDWFGTWVGSTLGMVAADALAIGVGAVLGRRLPERVIRIGAAVAFLVFGILLIAEGLGLLP